MLDVATKKLTKVDESNQLKNDEFFWEVSDYGWSPDSKWVCYSLVQYNKNSQVFIYNLEQGKKYAVTDDFYDNLNPCFDQNGDYLYFLSSRNFDIAMDFYEDNHIVRTPQSVMAVQLKDGQKPPFLESEENDAKKKEARGSSDRRRRVAATDVSGSRGGRKLFLPKGGKR